jgi:hypothetical protein
MFLQEYGWSWKGFSVPLGRGRGLGLGLDFGHPDLGQLTRQLAAVDPQSVSSYW